MTTVSWSGMFRADYMSRAREGGGFFVGGAVLRVALIVAMLASPALAAMDRAACEAWRDGLAEHNALRLQSARVAMALAIEAMARDHGDVVTDEADALGDVSKGKAFARALDAYRRVCLAE